MNRREFMALIGGAGLSVCAGCKSLSTGAPSGTPHMVNAGPLSQYTADGVYDKWRSEGFFVIRQNGRLFALSSICPHRQCTVNVEPDHSFLCPCHGSTFTPDGKVTEGPATQNLPELATGRNAAGDLLVTVVS